VAEQPEFRAAVEAVRLDVSVTRGTTPVAGLTAANFEVLDNGVPQAIDRVSQEDVPLNLMLVLDTSGSMAGVRLGKLIDAARNLVRSLRPEDRVGVLSFSQRVVLSLPPGHRTAWLLRAAVH
jgi:secreted protein with Ig-like and vWFA domain